MGLYLFMNKILLLPLVLALVALVCWVTNFNKLIDCDFKAPYKCEAIHGIGILPPAALVTAWFDVKDQP